MPWLIENHTRLTGEAAVPTPVFALEVQRGSMPGQPGGFEGDSLTASVFVGGELPSL